MTNDLKNFLEEKQNYQDRLFPFGGDDYDFNSEVYKQDNIELVNYVLDLVEKEVEISMAEHNEARHGNTPDDAYARVSTIINNLRV